MKRGLLLIGLVLALLAVRWIALGAFFGPDRTVPGPGFHPVSWDLETSYGIRVADRRGAELVDGVCRLAPGGSVSIVFDGAVPPARRLDWAYSGDRLLVDVRIHETSWDRVISSPASRGTSQAGLLVTPELLHGPPELWEGRAMPAGIEVRLSTPRDGTGAVVHALAFSDPERLGSPPVLVDPPISRRAVGLLAVGASLLIATILFVRRRGSRIRRRGGRIVS